MPLFDPQINPQQAQSLADLMGGGTAGAYLGMQGALQQDMNQTNRALSLADLTKINQENELYKAKMPNEMLVSDALGREATSKTAEHFGVVRAGERGQARSLMAKGDLDQATLQSNIDNTLGEHKSKALKRMGEDFTQVATYIGTLPPEAQGPAMQEIIASRPWGANESMASAWQAFGKLPPDQMRAQLIKAGEFLSKSNPEHIMQLIKEREGNTSKEKIAAGNNAAIRYAADARRKDLTMEMAKEWTKAPVDTKAAILQQLVATALENTDAYVELPDGTQMETQRALDLVKQYSASILAKKAAGAPKTDVGLPLTNPVGTGMGNIYGVGQAGPVQGKTSSGVAYTITPSN